MERSGRPDGRDGWDSDEKNAEGGTARATAGDGADDHRATKGTDALTLGHVAECAGVSKPIAYEHFGTRAGLLDRALQRL